MEFLKIFGIYALMFFVMLKHKAIVSWFINFFHFLYWVVIDISRFVKSGCKHKFNLFGVRVFTGRQGSGKTVGLVWQLQEIRRKYPKCKIYTNFEFEGADGRLNNLNDLLVYRNGQDGIVFAIDELQNEFSSAASKDFPESLLSTITMQRKQKICILATSQVFTRLAKPLREQCFQVIECRTFFNRWTRLRAYDAEDYNLFVDNPSPEKKFKTKKLWKRSFIQTDDLRTSYDTMEVIERLSRQGFSPKNALA